MTNREARQLQPGDEVFWHDPDEGACSRTMTIQSVRVNGGVVSITDRDGSVVECFARELE